MIRRTLITGFLSIAALVMTASLTLAQSQTSRPFAGGKVNGGTVTHSTKDGKDILTLSDDFKVPDTPAPTWRVVDSRGNVYTLDAFKIKGWNGEKRQVVVPAYVQDIVTVQVYCAWAEVLLGEAKFASAVK